MCEAEVLERIYNHMGGVMEKDVEIKQVIVDNHEVNKNYNIIKIIDE